MDKFLLLREKNMLKKRISITNVYITIFKIDSWWEFAVRHRELKSGKGFGIVNKAKVDIFLELSFSMIQQMLAI